MIYSTQFKNSTKQVVGISVDSGFKTLDEAVNLMGDNFTFKNSRMVIYGDTEDRVVLSNFRFK